jgi:hypothetical protein
MKFLLILSPAPPLTGEGAGARGCLMISSGAA